MRLFALSDIHVDYRANLEWVRALSRVDYLDDVLVLAGDISHESERVREAFELLLRRFGQVMFVPGNHDLWLRDGEHADSLMKLRALLRLCDELGVITEPRRVDQSGAGKPMWVVPLFSWYEKPEEGASSLYVEKSGEDPTLSMWVDNWAVRWPDFGGGITPASYFIGMNEPAIAEVVDGDVVTFSHFLPRSELAFLSSEERAAWKGPLVDPLPEFNFSRVAGTTRLDDQLRHLGARLHVYGHQHRNRRLDIDGVRYISYCLGYPRERASGRTRGVTSQPLELHWDLRTSS